MKTMNKNTMLADLTTWIADIKKAAKEDISFSIAWFPGTKDAPFSIIAGWEKMFNNNNDFSDLFCCSKSQPEYVMSIKIAKNDGPYAYTDFEVMDMPTDKFGDIDDTCIPLELDDLPEAAADFFFGEWERIMAEHAED